MKKKHLWFSFIALFLVAVGFVSRYVKNDSTIVNAEQTYEVSDMNIDDGFTLGVVGDSWVSRGKLDKPIQEVLNASGVRTKIKSFSLPGRKSGEIYNDMVSDTSNFNSNDIIEDEEVDGVLIVSGVNDTAGHIGSDYYTQSIKNIISYANSKDKHVYILEVPEYGIEEKKPLLSTIKHNLYKIINDKGKTDVIEDYRFDLRTSLDSSELEDFTIISYPEKMDDYHAVTHLYNDQFHLNEEGSNLLGEEIGKQIAEEVLN